MENCERYDCQNKERNCFKCFNYAFYKEPKRKQRGLRAKKKTNVSQYSENSWENLEGEVANSLNKIPNYYEATRQLRSGALPFAPGDVSDPFALMECKERKGNELTARGEKSFTIQKEWLDKARQEATSERKEMFLPFRFKGDEEIYAVTQWKDIANLISLLKSMAIQNEKNELIVKELNIKIAKLERGQDNG